MRALNHSSFFLSCCILLLVQLTSLQSFAQKTKLKQLLPENSRSLLLTWGLPNFETENIWQETSKKYGIQLYRIGGCTMPYQLTKEASKHNKKLKNRIAKKFGRSWDAGDDKEFKRLNSLFRRADTILSYDSFFWANRPVPPPMDVDQIYYSEVHRDSVLRITICSINEWINNKLVAFREFELNLLTKKVTLIANKPNEALITSIKQ